MNYKATALPQESAGSVFVHVCFAQRSRLISHESRIRKRNLQPARVYKGKRRNPCHISNRILTITKNRLKRKTNELSTNGSALFDSVARTPFIQKRRKKNASILPGFDKNAGLVTSTPAPGKVLQNIQFSSVQKNTAADDSIRSGLDMTAAKPTAKKLFTPTGTELIELADTIDGDVSKELHLKAINSFSQLINASANAEMYKDCRFTSNSNPPIDQLDVLPTISVVQLEHISSAAETLTANVLSDGENNQNPPNSKNASLSDARKPTGRQTDANQRNIRFVTSRTMSPTLESSANEDNANIQNKLVIKSGKWRRTLYELRNKITQCKYIHHHRKHLHCYIYTIYYIHIPYGSAPKRSDNHELANVERPSVNHRKSIFVRDVSVA